jgi:hypothetical protein
MVVAVVLLVQLVLKILQMRANDGVHFPQHIAPAVQEAEAQEVGEMPGLCDRPELCSVDGHSQSVGHEAGRQHPTQPALFGKFCGAGRNYSFSSIGATAEQES